MGYDEIMSVDLQRLIHLEAVFRLRSFSLAADELGRTQPTISRSIAYLEERWKVRLFDRELGGVTPTKVGMDLIQDVESLLAQVKVIDHNMGVRARGGGGSVDFGIAPMVGAIATTQALADTFQAFPALLVKVRMEPLADLLAHLKKGVIDFAVFSETVYPDERDLIFQKVGSIPLGLIVRKNHPLRQVKRPVVSHLSDYPIAATTYMRDYGDLPQPGVVCDSYAVNRDLVIKSDFMWFTSPLIFSKELNEDRAAIINIYDSNLPESTDIFVAYKKGKISSPAALNVLGCVIGVLGGPMAVTAG